MDKTIEEIESGLDELQLAYLSEEDERLQMELIRKFTALLQEATALDGIDRLASNVTITNWTREED